MLAAGGQPTLTLVTLTLAMLMDAVPPSGQPRRSAGDLVRDCRRRPTPAAEAIILCFNLSMCITAHDRENERTARVEAGRVLADGQSEEHHAMVEDIAAC